MTNYRLNICRVHDLLQFKHCFDCGAPIVEDGFTYTGDSETQTSFTCSKNWVHLRLFVYEHTGDDEKTGCPSECLTFE